MSPQSLHLKVTHTVTEGKSRRLTQLIREDGTSPIELFHEFDREIPWSDTTLLDGHALIVLPYAMANNTPMRVHGQLSRTCVRYMEELQLVWCCWKPERYKKILILPDAVVDARRANSDRAIAAFSGGVDATFTALRHTHTQDPTRYPVTDLLMVHGFDVELQNPTHFQQLVQRVHLLIEELGVTLRTVRTNSKEVLPLDWEDVFAMQLAGCMQMFSEDFGYGLIGSTEPYNALVFPWGSTPATDYLLSSDLMTIVHDGAAFSRTEKIAAIMECPTACKTIKVCWIGGNRGTNCGVCEKCTRTKLNFLAAGESNPGCFDEPLDWTRIADIRIANATQLGELKGIVDYVATRRGDQPAWLPLLNKRICRGINNEHHSVAKRMVVGILEVLGLKVVAKKLWRYVKSKARLSSPL